MGHDLSSISGGIGLLKEKAAGGGSGGRTLGSKKDRSSFAAGVADIDTAIDSGTSTAPTAGIDLGTLAGAVITVEQIIPNDLTVNVGSRTRVGWGGDTLGYTGNGTLMITAGNEAGHWQIDALNMLVPKNGAGAYGSAPPAFAGPYTLTITDVTAFTRTVTINIIADDCHVRGTAPTGGAGQQLLAAVSSKTILLCGTSLWLRSGSDYHPNTDALMYFECWDETQYGGAGTITIRSEVVDDTLDTWGWRNNRHGAELANIYMSPQSAGPSPFRFQDIRWYNTYIYGAERALFTCNLSTPVPENVTFYHCGFENQSTMSEADVSQAGGLSSLMTEFGVLDCTFRHLGWGVRFAGGSTGVEAKGTRPTVTGNWFYDIIDADAMQFGGNILSMTIVGNYAAYLHPVSGGHCDFFQYQGLDGISGPGGRIAENFLAYSIAQGIFISDMVSGTFTSITIENNHMAVSLGNMLLAENCDDIIVRWNNAIAPQAAGDVAVLTLDGGEDATITRNVANAYSFTGQTGVLTKVPNPQTTILPTTAAYQAVWPGYLATQVDFSIAGFKLQCTPSIGGFATLASSGVLKPGGAFNDTP